VLQPVAFVYPSTDKSPPLLPIVLSSCSTCRDFTKQGGLGCNGSSIRIYGRLFARNIEQFGFRSNADLPEIETVFVITFSDRSATDDLYNTMTSTLGNFVESAVIDPDPRRGNPGPSSKHERPGSPRDNARSRGGLRETGAAGRATCSRARHGVAASAGTPSRHGPQCCKTNRPLEVTQAAAGRHCCGWPRHEVLDVALPSLPLLAKPDSFRNSRVDVPPNGS
jgi:hypothetical protein